MNTVPKEGNAHLTGGSSEERSIREVMIKLSCEDKESTWLKWEGQGKIYKAEKIHVQNVWS